MIRINPAHTADSFDVAIEINAVTFNQVSSAEDENIRPPVDILHANSIGPWLESQFAGMAFYHQFASCPLYLDSARRRNDLAVYFNL